jgi:ABC-2 type transport system permease protein
MMATLTAMLYRETRIRVTNFTLIFWDLFHPLAYLLIFGVGMTEALGVPFAAGSVNYNAFFLAGVLGMASFGVAANTSWTFFLDRDNGIFYEMLTYPLSRSAYLLGKVLFNVSVAVVQAVLTVVLAAAVVRVPLRWELLPLLLAAVVVGTMGWSSFYSIFALITRRNDVFNSITSIFYFLFLFASSIFYPLEPLPAWFRTASLANPITWQVDVMRYATIGIGHPRALVWESLAFLVFTAASFLICVRCLRSQE